MKLLAALQFLTVIPIPRRHEVNAEELGASLVYFPLVGLFLGAILAGINWSLSLVLPSSVVNAVIIIALLLLTGALHVDGFIAGAAALIATGLCPGVKDYIIPAHVSAEVGHRAILDYLRLKPLLDLEMRLGEGTGAALAISIVEAAAKTLAEMDTFADAGVSEKLD